MNITIKTIQKVKDAIVENGNPVSINHIATREKIHPSRVKTAIGELMRYNEVKCITNSTGISLYTKNEN